MSEYDRTQLDKALRKRAEIVRAKRNPPPELHVAALAAKYGISEQEVVNRANELNRT